MVVKKPSESSVKRKAKVGLAAKPISRIQTAEGWRRSRLSKRK